MARLLALCALSAAICALLQPSYAATLVDAERAAVLREYAHLQPEIDLWLKLGKPSSLAFHDRGDASHTGLLVELPQRPALFATDFEANVLYYLFTRENPNGTNVAGNAKAFKEAGWKASRPTKVVIHGFTNNIHSDIFATMVPALMQNEDVNVVAVDWGALCPSPFYVTARSHVCGTGKQVAKLVDALVQDAGLDLARLHVLGHSLGAHVSGCIGKNTKSGKIGRITGLDPAMPLFLLLTTDRLSKGDANLVDVVHTCGGLLGLEQAIGDVDFYPNGGSQQGGCGIDLAGSCRHARSYQYVAESATEPEAFAAAECATASDAAGGDCGDQFTGQMGINLKYNPDGSGAYFLKTASSSPFDLEVHARMSGSGEQA